MNESTNGQQVVFYFPSGGCEEAKPMTKEEVEKLRKGLAAAVKRHWDNPGVKAIVQLLEMQAATLGMRACQPGGGPHDGGQAFSLQQLLGELQRMRWGAGR